MRLPLSPTQQQLADRLARRTPEEAKVANPWYAAVAVLVAPDPDAILLIHRAEREGDPWSGHIGLPGGRHDPTDQDLLVTAIRETGEEVGCHLGAPDLLGVLDDVWPRTPLKRTVVVRPYVFSVAGRPQLTLSDEVARAFWVDLAELRDPTNHRQTTRTLFGEPRTFPAYQVAGHEVWGLTERVLASVLGLIS